MLTAILLTIGAAVAAIGASALAPAVLGRVLTIWEVLLCGTGGLIVAWSILRYRKYQDRKHLVAMRDSALW